MKDYITLKILVATSLTTLALAPKALYHASNYYLETYHKASNYITETSNTLLSKVGLETIKPEDLSFHIDRYSKQYNLNPLLISALINQESGNNKDAISLKGAIGYSQIMPANYKRCGLKNPSDLWDTSNNIKCGCQILSEELKTYNGNLEKALYSYNGGSLAYSRKYPESVNYSNKVMKQFAQLALNSLPQLK